MWVKGSARAYTVRQVAWISDSAALDQSNTELQGHTHTRVVGVVHLCCHGFGRYYRVVRWLQLRFLFDSTAVRLPFDRGTTIRQPAL